MKRLYDMVKDGAPAYLLMIDSLIAMDWEVFWDALKHMALPAAVLGLYGLAGIAETGPLLPCLSGLDPSQRELVAAAANALLSFPNAT